jgi:glycosyltransferase involved in cell wall biosynthesis
MDELYAGANLAVVPSLTEPLSYIVLEAGMRGIPLIVTSSGGPAELVDHKRTGLVCAPGSAPELTEALRRAAQDYETMIEYGGRLRAELVVRNTVDAMADAYIRLYKRIAGHGGVQ